MNFKFLIFFILFLGSISCNKSNNIDKPNVILIMSDDLGYEAIGINGANEYNTPVLDSLARNGINFNNAYSQPLCTPSRVKIMTGKPNYINYEYFTYLNPNEKTFGNLFQDNGYKTTVVGKWQLNGVQYDLENNQDLDRPHKSGFDEYCLWWLIEQNQRFANPLIVQNGIELNKDIDDYGPDIFTDYIIKFIENNKDDPFFIYYPMALVHDPFRPTPYSDDWKNREDRNNGNNEIYFPDYINYADKIVGKIASTLNKNNLDNTILIFIGDNGTDTQVVTLNNDIEIRGAKGSTIKYASNVPMIVNWKKNIKKGFKSDALIDFTDFYATFEDILNVKKTESYGKSLLPLFNNKDYKEREVLITYYNPMWGANNPDISKGVYAQNKEYKLYKRGDFFKYSEDLYEKKQISISNLTNKENQIYNTLKASLDTIPNLPKYNHNNWIEKGLEVKQSGKITKTWESNKK